MGKLDNPNLELAFYNKVVNAFFFSHQDRLRTSIIKRFNMLNSTHFNKKAKFFNGCILYLQIRKKNQYKWDDQWKFELSMIYEGDTSERKKGDIYFRDEEYGKVNHYDNYNIEFKPVVAMLNPKNLQSIFHIDPNYLDEHTIYNLYLMRHGQAQHNVKFVYNPIINTELTNAGKLQARDAGNKWAKWAERNGISSIDYFCVSDLFRTQQTAAMFLFGVRNYGFISRDKHDNLSKLGIRFDSTEDVNIIPTKEEYMESMRQEEELRRPEWDVNAYQQRGGGVYNVPIINTENLKVIVLPCLHELEKGQDDGKISSYGLGHLTSALTLGTTSGIVSRENITNCRSKTLKQKYRFYEPNTKDCSNLPKITNTPNPIISDVIPMNWDYYNNFYKGYRDQISVGGREHCANTHFLEEFFKIINPNPVKRVQPLASGKVIVPRPPPVLFSSNNGVPVEDITYLPSSKAGDVPSSKAGDDILFVGSGGPVKRGTGGGGPVQPNISSSLIDTRQPRKSWFSNPLKWSRTNGGSRTNRVSKYKKTRKYKKCKKTRKNSKK